MIVADKYEADFKDFLNKFSTLLSGVMDSTISFATEDYKESINELSIIAKTFGLHYGLNYRFRRCNSQYIQSTDNGINIIDLNIAFNHLLKSLLNIQKAIIEGKKVFLCGDIKLEHNLTNLYSSNSWIPGTLTNAQYAMQKYKFIQKTVQNNNMPNKPNYLSLSLIVSLSPKLYGVISKEVLNIINKEIIFDVNKGRKKHLHVNHIGIVDTNINTLEHTNITNICINSYSRYTKRMLSHLIQVLLASIVKKSDV